MGPSHAVGLEGLVDEPAVEVDGDLPAVEDGGAHVDPDRADLPVLGEHGGLEVAGQGVDGEDLPVHEALVVGVLGDASDPVAAHLGLAAVGVDDAHGYVGALSGHDVQHAVRSDAEVAVAHHLAPAGVDDDPSLRPVYEDEVVAETLVLPEPHLRSLSGMIWCLHCSSTVSASRMSSALPSFTRTSAHRGREL